MAKQKSKGKKSEKSITISPGMIKTVLIVALVALVALIFFSTQKEEKPAELPGEEVIEPPKEDIGEPSKLAGRVGGEEITVGEVEKQYQELPEVYRKQFKIKEFFEGILTQKTLLLEAKERGLESSTEEIDKVLEQNAAQNQLTVPQFLELMQEKGLNEEKVRQVVKEKVLVDKVLAHSVEDVTATDEELKEFYDKNQEQFKHPDLVHARHILVNKTEEIQEIKALLDQGENFAELAKERSLGPSGANGGDLGFFTKEQMVPEFSEAAFTLEENEISEPVQTPYGWHIIQVLEKKPEGVADFEDVKEQLRLVVEGEKKQEAATEFIEEMKKKYGVENMLG